MVAVALPWLNYDFESCNFKRMTVMWEDEYVLLLECLTLEDIYVVIVDGKVYVGKKNLSLVETSTL